MPLLPVLLALLLAWSPAVRGQEDPSSSEASQPAKSKPRVSPPRAKPAVQRTGPPYAERDDAMEFAEEIAAKRDLDPAWVRRMIGQARNLAIVSRLMQPPPASQPKNWRVYRSRFIDATRISAGVRFWNDNRKTLE